MYGFIRFARCIFVLFHLYVFLSCFCVVWAGITGRMGGTFQPRGVCKSKKGTGICQPCNDPGRFDGTEIGLKSDWYRGLKARGYAHVTAVALDYEQQNRYFVRIETRDANGLTFSCSFTIVVSNVPEGDLTAFTNLYLSNWMVAENQVPPVFVGKISAEGASASKAAFELVTGDDVNEHPYALYVSGFAVEEQAPIHSLVGTLMAFDPDLVDAHTFQLVSGLGDVHNSDFVIHQDSLLTNKVLSRTDGISRQVRVEVSDLAGATYVTTLQLVVNPSTELIQPTANAYMAFVDGSTLTVQIPSNALSQNTSIVLYNMLGQEVLRAPMESIHHQWTMDHLNKGIYLLQWMQADRPVQRMHIRH